MNKLMIAFAAVALAVSAQAAKVNWGFEQYYDADPNGANLTGYDAYLITAADWDAKDVATSLTKAIAVAEFADWTTAEYVPGDEGYSYFNKEKGGASGISDSLIGTGVDAYIVFANDKMYAASSVTGDIVADDTFTTFTSFSANTELATSDLQAYGVPEPTSGLLLLLGVAGLALKRRRA